MLVFWRCLYCQRFEKVKNFLSTHIRKGHPGRDPTSGVQDAIRMERQNESFVDPRGVLPPRPSVVTSRREEAALERRRMKEEADRLNLFPPAPTYIIPDEVVNITIQPGGTEPQAIEDVVECSDSEICTVD
jgi:hypothetical protein